MKLSLIKTNQGNRYGEGNEFNLAKSFDGATIRISNELISLITASGVSYNFKLHEWEEDYFYSTKKSTYPNGQELRILQSKLEVLGQEITFASMFGNGYAVHYEI